MQITIVQVEIEQAIRNYVLEQLSVKEGMQIDIVLKATRGDEGTTAIIDIVPAKAAQKAQVKQAAVAKVLGNISPKANQEDKQVSQVQQQEQEQVKGEAQALASDSTNTSTQAGGQTGDAGLAAIASAEVGNDQDVGTGTAENASSDAALANGTDAATADAPRKSLFAGLKKPVNA